MDIGPRRLSPTARQQRILPTSLAPRPQPMPPPAHNAAEMHWHACTHHQSVGNQARFHQSKYQLQRRLRHIIVGVRTAARDGQNKLRRGERRRWQRQQDRHRHPAGDVERPWKVRLLDPQRDERRNEEQRRGGEDGVRYLWPFVVKLSFLVQNS